METASPVSRATALHVSLTSGRGDVTAHAAADAEAGHYITSRRDAPEAEASAGGGGRQRERVDASCDGLEWGCEARGDSRRPRLMRRRAVKEVGGSCVQQGQSLLSKGGKRCL